MAELSRRTFLARTSAAAGGLALGVGAACSGSDDDTAGSDAGAADDRAAPFDPGDWASVRAQFPLRTDKAQFAAYVLASHPAPVAEAVARHRAGLDEDTHAYLAATETDAELAVHEAAVEYLGAQPGEVALTDSTTMGLGLLYVGLRLRGGDEVLTTEHDFYSTHQAWRLRTDRDGVTVRRVRLYDDPAAATADDMVGRLMAAVTPTTRVVAVTWVHSGTGVRLPVRAIADALAQANAGRSIDERTLLCVDGVHGLGAVDAGRWATSAATSSWRAPTSGCSGRAAPASCGGAPTPGHRSPRPSRRSSPTASASGATACPRRRPTACGSRRAATTASSTAGRWPRRSGSTSTSGATGWPAARPSRPARSRRGWPRSPG